MRGRESIGGDHDGWTPHALITIFAALVAAILAAVPGWSAPLHAWITLAAFAIAALAAHAALRAVSAAAHRHWRPAVIGVLVATALASAAAVLIVCGRLARATPDDLFTDAPSPSRSSTR